MIHQVYRHAVTDEWYIASCRGYYGQTLYPTREEACTVARWRNAHPQGGLVPPDDKA